jgi:tripartite-type tricarboxylate transporter receptor subunit TctC
MCSAALALAVACAPNAAAQAWPTKPVRMIIAFPPGGGTDISGRLLAKRYTETLGQSFVVENRGGAGGVLGAEAVAKAPPDGYTILVTTASLSVNATLHRKLPFDPVKDLAPLSWIASVPLVLFVHSSVPAKSVKELVGLARKRPDAMNAGSNGAGTTSHLAIEMFNQAAGIKAAHVPYKGGGPAQIALLSGEIDFRFGSVFASIHHLRAGRYRALAVTTEKPSSLLPEVPTMNSIYPGFVCDQWYAMFVPAGTPKDIVTRLHAETVKAINSDEMREQLKRDGAYAVGSTPEELSAMFAREIARYAKVIATAKIKAD